MKLSKTGMAGVLVVAAVAATWLTVAPERPVTTSPATPDTTETSSPAASGACPKPFSDNRSATPSSGDVTAARHALAGLVVVDEDTGAHYDRDQWMPHGWNSLGHQETTRTVVLDRDRCADGTWTSPYDQHHITEPSKVDIDHVVPLAEAQRSGARSWVQQQREAFANDLRNLIGVSQHANRSKSDDDPTDYRPENRGLWCAYSEQYIGVKTAYHLTIDTNEKAALTSMLNTCQEGQAHG